MTSERIVARLAAAAIFCLVLTAGCARQPSAVTPKLTPGETATYRVTTSTQRSVEFRGSLADDPAFQSGRTGHRIELVFTQQIQSLDKKGNAEVKITIKQLSYRSQLKDDPTLQFDSSAENAEGPLARLIGQSYTIAIDVNGQVTGVIDTRRARAAVQGDSPVHKTALRILEPDVIKHLHSIPALPVTKKGQLAKGNNWSNVKTFSFGTLGSRTYERIYTVKKISELDNHRIAFVQMRAAPVSQAAEQSQIEQQQAGFSAMTPDAEAYTGLFDFDLTTGRLNNYSERLDAEWLVIDPQAEFEDNRQPDALKMSVGRAYTVKRID